jgi:putative PIN family toxin of toxin-antitoxin system
VKVFMDTNVLVSAFATRGLSAELLQAVALEHELFVGREVLAEFARVLGAKFKVPAEGRAEAMQALLRNASGVVEDSEPADCDADREDRRILGEAMASGAQVFVTGDQHLVALGAVGSMKILTPRQLWELLRKDPAA